MNYLTGGLGSGLRRTDDALLLNALGIERNVESPFPVNRGLASGLLSDATELGAVRSGEKLWVEDAFGWSFRFQPWTFNRRIFGSDVVYIMARRDVGRYTFIYIGKADALSSRMSDHEKWEAAASLGANTILVHDTQGQPLGHELVESRLLRSYETPLNTKRR